MFKCSHASVLRGSDVHDSKEFGALSLEKTQHLKRHLKLLKGLRWVAVEFSSSNSSRLQDIFFMSSTAPDKNLLYSAVL